MVIMLKTDPVTIPLFFPKLTFLQHITNNMKIENIYPMKHPNMKSFAEVD